MKDRSDRSSTVNESHESTKGRRASRLGPASPPSLYSTTNGTGRLPVVLQYRVQKGVSTQTTHTSPVLATSGVRREIFFHIHSHSLSSLTSLSLHSLHFNLSRAFCYDGAHANRSAHPHAGRLSDGDARLCGISLDEVATRHVCAHDHDHAGGGDGGSSGDDIHRLRSCRRCCNRRANVRGCKFKHVEVRRDRRRVPRRRICRRTGRPRPQQTRHARAPNVLRERRQG